MLLQDKLTYIYFSHKFNNGQNGHYYTYNCNNMRNIKKWINKEQGYYPIKEPCITPLYRGTQIVICTYKFQGT